MRTESRHDPYIQKAKHNKGIHAYYLFRQYHHICWIYVSYLTNDKHKERKEIEYIAAHPDDPLLHPHPPHAAAHQPAHMKLSGQLMASKACMDMLESVDVSANPLTGAHLTCTRSNLSARMVLDTAKHLLQTVGRSLL